MQKTRGRGQGSRVSEKVRPCSTEHQEARDTRHSNSWRDSMVHVHFRRNANLMCYCVDQNLASSFSAAARQQPAEYVQSRYYLEWTRTMDTPHALSVGSLDVDLA